MALHCNLRNAPQGRFGFGKNWESFLTRFSEDRADSARTNLLASLHRADLAGAAFLDIGSGSGLHSLAAWRSGAARVVSFDYDPHSVAATASLRMLAGEPVNWEIRQGSVLDAGFMSGLGTFDIVYSWGVLHHTGSMWDAIRNARIPLHGDGTFLIALYSDTTYRDASLGGGPTPEDWLRIKRQYNQSSEFGKKMMVYKDVWNRYLRPDFPHPGRFARALRNLHREIKAYTVHRGMEFWTDVRDWLGGWPMEFVKENECIAFCRFELGLVPLALRTGEGNTEFVFRPAGARNDWDTLVARREIRPLPGPYAPVDGYMWRSSVPALSYMANSPGRPRRSRLVLMENGFIAGYRNAAHEGIRRFGEGRYSHWEDAVLFSTADGGDPNAHGRCHEFFVEAE